MRQLYLIPFENGFIKAYLIQEALGYPKELKTSVVKTHVSHLNSHMAEALEQPGLKIINSRHGFGYRIFNPATIDAPRPITQLG